MSSLLTDAGVKGKGYNVTCDNFFTTKSLADSLLADKTSLVGTVRANNREVPPVIGLLLDKKMKVPLYTTYVYKTENNCTVTAYKAKPNKAVMILSSLHRSVTITEGEKHKPETIVYYNRTKCGVDSLDQMCRLYTTKAGTRRWPVAVFCNMLDLAGINAWILYRASLNSSISRRQFLLDLVTELCMKQNPTDREALAEDQPADVHGVASNASKRKHCFMQNCKNKTCMKCYICFKFVCGKCSGEKKKIIQVACNDCAPEGQ